MGKQIILLTMSTLVAVSCLSQQRGDQLMELLVVVADKLSHEYKTQQILQFDNTLCKLVILNPKGKYDAVKSQAINGNGICILSAEELHLHDVASYVELIDYRIKSKAAFIELFFIETATASSPLEKLTFKLRFIKKDEQWVLQ